MQIRVIAFLILFLPICWRPAVYADDHSDPKKDTILIFQGRVVDNKGGKPIKNALVWLKNQGNSKEISIVTNGDGQYKREGVEPGVYFVCVQKDGYYSPHHHVLIHKSMSYRINNSTRKCVLDFSLVKKEDDPKLTGVLFDDAGYHLKRTTVTLKGFDEQYRTDDYGTYVIPDIPEKLKTLIVKKDGFVTREFYLLAPRALSETNSGDYRAVSENRKQKRAAVGYSRLNPDFSQDTFNIEVMRLSEPVAAGPEGWVDKRYSGTEITIPPGALEGIEDIQITRIPTEFIELNEDRVPVPNPVDKFDFKPEGLTFQRPVRIVTEALTPLEYAPGKDVEGELVVLNASSGKTERIPAYYDHDAHTITYELTHFSRLTADGKMAGQFVEKSGRTETVKETDLYPRCVPRGCVDCIEFEYYMSWGFENRLSVDLDYRSVRFKGRITSAKGSCTVCRSGEKVNTKRCDASGCRYVSLVAGGSGVFDINAYHLTPWFSLVEGFYAYVVQMIDESYVAQCLSGDPCGDGVKCDDDPSECCRKVCDQGRCSKYEESGRLVECQKCGPMGKCIPDNTMPCSDGDPCTVRDRCVGGRCVGFRPASLKDPDCLKGRTGSKGKPEERVYKPY